MEFLRLRTLVAAAAGLAATVSVALADGPSVVEEMAGKAMAKGYGATCSLAMKPVRTGGYYPCLDFGPYRFVRGYGKVYGLVVQKGHEPFLVMSGAEGDPHWLYDGPWQTDMPARVVMFWNDTVEGGAAKRSAAEEAASDRQAAAEYIRKLRGEAELDAKDESAAAPANKAAEATPPEPAPPTEPIGLDARRILAAD